MKEKIFDVVAVDLKKHTVRFIAENKDHRNAEAIENMAVMRRGVDEEFFCVVRHGLYKEGEHWEGAE